MNDKPKNPAAVPSPIERESFRQMMTLLHIKQAVAMIRNSNAFAAYYNATKGGDEKP